MKLRIATYNVHSFVGTDGVHAPERILDNLRKMDADINVLQEVSNENGQDSGRLLLDWLADELTMYPFLGETLRRRDSAYGNACLTRIPPRFVKRHDLTVGANEPRGLLEIFFETEGTPWRLMTTHLGLRPGERRRQYKRIARLLEHEAAGITVLAGDFNDLGLPRELTRGVYGTFSRVRRRTFPSVRPVLPLDRIHVSPGTRLRSISTASRALARNASDHLPLVAEIELHGHLPTSISAGPAN